MMKVISSRMTMLPSVMHKWLLHGLNLKGEKILKTRHLAAVLKLTKV